LAIHREFEVESKDWELFSAQPEPNSAELPLRKIRYKNARRRHRALSLLVGRINDAGLEQLAESRGMCWKFTAAEDTEAVVMSIDIRRSTELMLKARSAPEFAEFISELAEELGKTVIQNYGVLDKFTGDGILAYFPRFFTGPDAVLHALVAADNCHRIFKEKYAAMRSKFRAVMSDAGLGIGIDLGPVRILEIAGSLTVVGSPVVYACRFGSAPAGSTYINQGAVDDLWENDEETAWSIAEQTLEIKHEGSIVAYEAIRTEAAPRLRAPEDYWSDLDKELHELDETVGPADEIP
jgi:class 3 adenylate cyclase